MPRKQKPARLWLRPERRDDFGSITHEATWYIRDIGKQIGTGCSADDTEEAERQLNDYVSGHHPLVTPTVAAERPALLRRSAVGNVYFISCDKALFPIKIGYAVDVRVRLRALQGAIPWPLQVLFSMQGDVTKERELHRQFSHLRMEGEWFARGHELLEYITQVKAMAGKWARK